MQMPGRVSILLFIMNISQRFRFYKRAIKHLIMTFQGLLSQVCCEIIHFFKTIDVQLFGMTFMFQDNVDEHINYITHR